LEQEGNCSSFNRKGRGRGTGNVRGNGKKGDKRARECDGRARERTGM